MSEMILQTASVELQYAICRKYGNYNQRGGGAQYAKKITQVILDYARDGYGFRAYGMRKFFAE